jgi:multicomponent Na+:H+ antiporter subunit E
MTAVRNSGVLLWITVLWVFLWGNLSVANVASGLTVAVIVLAVARLPRTSSGANRGRLAPLAALHFVGFFLYKLFEANIFLAWEIVTPKNRINTGIVEVPLRTESNVATMIVANVITLTPGSLVIEAVGSPPVLYVNVLHLHDLDRVRRDLLRIEELSVRAFGSAVARRQLAGSVA